MQLNAKPTNVNGKLLKESKANTHTHTALILQNIVACVRREKAENENNSANKKQNWRMEKSACHIEYTRINCN